VSTWAKAVANGLKSWMKSSKEAVAKTAHVIKHGDPMVKLDVPVEDIARRTADVAGKADLSHSAMKYVSEQALQNPKFQFKTRHTPVAERGVTLSESLDIAKKQHYSAKTYAPDEAALQEIKTLTRKKQGLLTDLGKVESENHAIAVQKEIDNVSYQIRDLRHGKVEFNEKTIQDLKFQGGLLDIHPDVVEAKIRGHKFTELTSMFEKAAKEKSYIDVAVVAKDMCHDFKVPQATIDKVFKDPNMSWHAKGAKLIEMANEAQKVFDDALGLTGKKINIEGLGTVDKMLTGVEAKIGNAIDYFSQKGNVLGVKSMQRLAAVARNGGAIKSKIGQLAKEIELRDSVLGEKTMLALREYAENRNFAKAIMYSEHPTRKTILANPELAKELSVKYNVKFGYEEMRYANQRASILREMKRFEHFWHAGDYDTAARELPRSIREIDGTTVRYINDKFRNDLGANYHSRVANEEWLIKNGKKFAEDKAIYDAAVRDNDFGNQLKFFERRRLDSPELALNENRLSPTEELKKYMSAMTDASVRREGLRAINDAKFATLMPMDMGKANLKNMKAEHRYIKVIEDQWKTNFNPKGVDGMNPALKWLMKYSRVAIPLALASEKMVMSNAYQAVFTGGYRHGYVKTLAATTNEVLKFGKEVVLHPMRTKQIMDLMAKGDFDKAIQMGEKGMLMRNLYRYQQNNTGLHTMLDEDLKSIFMGAGKDAGMATKLFAAVGELITLPFTFSDQISRRAAFTAAHWHGEGALKKLQRNLKNIELGKAGKMTREEAIKTFCKDLHLDTFNLGNDRAYILQALNFDNIKNTTEEFLFRYANRSMRQEIFDYSVMGQSLLKGKAKELHPLAGVAMTFTSWPMYFHELSKGAVRAYKNGDKAPLAKLIAAGVVTYAAAASAMNEDSPYQRALKPYMDEGGVKGYAAKVAGGMPGYMQARAPFASYGAFVSKVMESPLGILTPPVGMATYPMIAALDELSLLLSGDEKGMTAYMRTAAKKASSDELVYRRLLYISRALKDIGVFDMDLNEAIKEIKK